MSARVPQLQVRYDRDTATFELKRRADNDSEWDTLGTTTDLEDAMLALKDYLDTWKAEQ